MSAYGGYGTMPGDELGLCPCGHRDAMCHRANAARWCPGAHPTVAGVCPNGCGTTLFLGSGGHITCSWIDCSNPAAADELLQREVPA